MQHRVFLILLQLLFFALSYGQTKCYEAQNNIAKSVVARADGGLIWTTHHGVYFNSDQALQKMPFHEKYPSATGATWAITELENQESLIFFLTSGLFHFTPDSTFFTPVRASVSSGVNSPEIYNMLALGDTLFMTTIDGLSIYSISKRTEVSLLKFTNNKDTLINRRNPNLVRGMVLDPIDRDVLWICGNKGVFYFNHRKNEIEQFEMDADLVLPAHRKILPEFTYLLMDMVKVGDLLYMTSWGGGLVSFNTRTKQWKNFLFEDYKIETLIEQNVNVNIEVFNDSLLLISARIFSPYFFNINSETNIPFVKIMDVSPELNINNAIHLAPPFVWISYMNRICRYSIPDRWLSETSKASELKIFLSGISSHGKKLNDYIGTRFEFPELVDKSTTSIDFEISTLGFSEPDNIEFKYRLVGYDKNWQSNGNNNKISFSKISGGKYQFLVRAEEGDRQLEMSSYTFVIEKELWEKIWFQLLCLLFSGLIIAGVSLVIRKNRAEKLRLQNEHRIQLQQAELSTLRAQMNPHFLFNSLASINQYIMYEDPRNASRYLAKFAHLMRRILNNSMSNLISLEEELETITLYVEVESIRFKDQFKFEKIIDPKLDTHAVYLPTMVIQPLLENAILHGLVEKKEAGVLKLIVESVGTDQLKISIEDNGIGRVAAAKRIDKFNKDISLGLKITRERLELLKDVNGLITDLQIEDLYDDAQEACGTKVILILPLITSKADK